MQRGLRKDQLHLSGHQSTQIFLQKTIQVWGWPNKEYQSKTIASSWGINTPDTLTWSWSTSSSIKLRNFLKTASRPFCRPIQILKFRCRQRTTSQNLLVIISRAEPTSQWRVQLCTAHQTSSDKTRTQLSLQWRFKSAKQFRKLLICRILQYLASALLTTSRTWLSRQSRRRGLRWSGWTESN